MKNSNAIKHVQTYKLVYRHQEPDSKKNSRLPPGKTSWLAAASQA